MGIDFLRLRPLNVLAERSRDHTSGFALVRLAPPAVFRTTDNHLPPTAKLLAGYDVVGICGNSSVAYSDAELDAIESFVRRRGGTLILAACSGAFERLAGLPLDRLAHQAVARRFGFAFGTGASIPDDLLVAHETVRGYAREHLELTSDGAASGLRIGDAWIDRPGPIDAPGGATVLVRERRTGAPVVAWARAGRGKVLVCNDLHMWGNAWVAAHWLALVDPERRVAAEHRPADFIEGPYRAATRGGIVLHTERSTHRQGERFARLARRVRDAMLRIARPAKPLKAWHVWVEAGCGSWTEWGADDEPSVHLGGSLSDAAAASELARTLAERLMWTRIGWQMRMQVRAATHYLHVRVLRDAGFGVHAGELEAAWAGGPRVDLGRLYSEFVTPPPVLRRFWLDAERQFGPRTFARVLRAIPDKDPFDKIDFDVFTELDVAASLLARAVGPRRAYAWLRAQGHTVREMPATAKLKTDGFHRGVRATVARLLADPTEPASDRSDAAAALAKRLKDDKVSFDACAKKASSSKLVEALPAALRLAQAKDERGRDALRRWLVEEALDALRDSPSLGGFAPVDVLLAKPPSDGGRGERGGTGIGGGGAGTATATPAVAMSSRAAAVASKATTAPSPTDTGLAAVAALALVFEHADPAAADALVRLAPAQDVRFQLSAGYALRLAGDPRAARFAFGALPGCAVRREHDGMIKAFPNVGGYDVANVWCQPMVRPVQYGGGYSVYYVQWVHTSPRWRRRGLARVGMDAALDDHWDRACAMTSLHTGTTNVAHALYRDYGLIDYFRGLRFARTLSAKQPEPLAKPPPTVRVRRAVAGDQPKAAELLNRQAERRPVERPYHTVWKDAPGRVAYVAVQKGRVVGYVAAHGRGDLVGVDAFAVDDEIKDPKPKKKRGGGGGGGAGGREQGNALSGARESVGLALLSAIHRDVAATAKKKPKTIEVRYWQPLHDDATCWMLRRAGYGSAIAGGVELYRVNSLARYLAEVTPQFERRLADNETWKSWRGVVALESDTQRASLAIDAGKVRVIDPATASGERQHDRGPAVVIRGDASALQRLVTGITSCFEEYLQIQVEASPLVNDSLQDLLGALFPRLIAE